MQNLKVAKKNKMIILALLGMIELIWLEKPSAKKMAKS
jgi:hypothetical protein